MRATEKLTTAKTLQSQLGTMDVSDPALHLDTILKCQSLINTLQDPGEKAMECFTSFTTFSCLAAVNDLKVFQKLSKGPLTSAQLGEQCDADPLLVARLMRTITSAGIVTEIEPESYAPTATSNILASPGFEAAFGLGARLLDQLNRFPQYLRETNYRNPSSYDNGPFQYCFGTELTTFEWLAQNPHIARDFNLFMTSQRAQLHWTETFSVKDGIFNGVEIHHDAPLVVDVAGGFGHDLRILKSKLPPVTKEQLVLEDQDSVIDTISDDMHDGGITYVKYDFFKPQPIKGARVYTLKSIIHDWPDDKALEILRNLASGLTPGYSKIWLLEGIVPGINASKALAGLDITMMVFLGALERTEAQWHDLLERAGLEVTKLVTREDGFGLIEAMIR